MRFLKKLRLCLEISRPGLWFQTLWLYLLPLARRDVEFGLNFYLGLFFVLFPLNFLVYGWNDIVDAALDKINPRKGNFLFGARAAPDQLRALPRILALSQLPFFVVFPLLAGPRILLSLVGMVAVLWLYNAPKTGWRGRPPLELLNQTGYLLLLPFSRVLNGVSNLPAASWLYLVLFCTHAHLMGEIMDVIPDRLGGRRTTATQIGVIPTKLAVMALVISEGLLLGLLFHDWILGGFLLAGVAWLLLDLKIWGEKPYTLNQFLLFGAGLNAAGFASMTYVWWSGTLTRLP